jgi:NTP pyrophosphatase (non-canonical NTP hydrolase)
MNDINIYQTEAMKYRLPTADETYCLLNLAAEAGEVVGKAAKLRRDGGDVNAYRDAIKKELGDVMWMVAGIASDNYLSMSDICAGNLMKLQSRSLRGVVAGSGDER